MTCLPGPFFKKKKSLKVCETASICVIPSLATILLPLFCKAYTCTKVLVAILNVIFIKIQMTIIRLKQAFNVGLCYTICGNHFVTLFRKANTCTKVLVAILNVIFIKFQMTIIRLKQAFNVGLCSIIIGNHFLPLFCKAYTCTKVLVAILNVIFMTFEKPIIIRFKQAFNVFDNFKHCIKCCP